MIIDEGGFVSRVGLVCWFEEANEYQFPPQRASLHVGLEVGSAAVNKSIKRFIAKKWCLPRAQHCMDASRPACVLRPTPGGGVLIKPS